MSQRYGCKKNCVRKSRKKWKDEKWRIAIAEKTNYKCCHCSKSLGENWEIEHYIPLSTCPEHAEFDVFENLFAAHIECNRKGHGSKNLFYLTDDENRWVNGFKPHEGVGDSKLTEVRMVHNAIAVKFELRRILQEINNEEKFPRINYKDLKKDKKEKKRIGGYGIVEKYEYNGKAVAVKKLREFYGIWQLKKEIELGINSDLDCPYIIRYLGYTILPDYNYGLVMEWIDQNLRMYFDSIEDHSKIDVVSIILQIADGLLFLHEKGIYHRDMKEDNIMIKDGIIKICDFGCVTLNEDSSTDTGTLGYKPPEMRREGSYNAKYADYFIFGKVIEKILNELLHYEYSTKELGKVLEFVRNKMICSEPSKRHNLEQFKDEVKRIFPDIRSVTKKIEDMKITKRNNQDEPKYYVSSPNSKVYHTQKGHYNANDIVTDISGKKRCLRCKEI